MHKGEARKKGGGLEMKRHGGTSSNDLTPSRKKCLKEENTA